ncbi:hypothetical protein ABPG75_005941 [Micractinium tetrahymenae]
MCIAFFLWEHPQLPDLQLVALFNRDEVLVRPTAASHFWQDQPCILGGRDLVAGGTWLCISRHGRAAFLTNFRELRDMQRLGAPSRGALPVEFVTAAGDPEAFLEGLDSKAYPGFNLLGFDLSQGRMLYLCNKHEGQRGRLARLPPGLHGITNGHMDAGWPKVREGCRRLQQLVDSGAFGSGGSGGSHCNGGIAGGSGAAGGRSDAAAAAAGGSGGGGGSSVPWEELFGLLSHDCLLEQNPERLPATGYGPEFEAKVSGIFVQPVDTRWGPFGTRSKIVLAVWRDGRAELREEYLTEHGTWQQAQHTFELCQCGGSGGCAGGGERGCGCGCSGAGASAGGHGGGASGPPEGQEAEKQARQPAG